MLNTKFSILLVLVLFLLPLFIMPSHAEVLFLTTNKPSYISGDKITFYGNVDSSDLKKTVNLVVQDPHGKLILITGNMSDSNNAFEIMINTSDHDQFHLPGMYRAVAFVNRESTGRTASFAFSPDGSSIVKTQPQDNSSLRISNETINSGVSQSVESANLTRGQKNNSVSSYPAGHNITLNEGIVIEDQTLNITKNNTGPKLLGMTPNGLDFKTVLYLCMVAAGVVILAVIFHYRGRKLRQSGIKSDSTKNSSPENGEKDDYAMMILKNRLAKGEIDLEEFRAIKDALGEP